MEITKKEGCIFRTAVIIPQKCIQIANINVTAPSVSFFSSSFFGWGEVGIFSFLFFFCPSLSSTGAKTSRSTDSQNQSMIMP